MADEPGATSWDEMLEQFDFSPEEQADIDRRAAELREQVEDAKDE